MYISGYMLHVYIIYIYICYKYCGGISWGTAGRWIDLGRNSRSDWLNSYLGTVVSVCLVYIHCFAI